MQKLALEKESDPGSVERLHRLTEELANVERTCDPSRRAGRQRNKVSTGWGS